MCKTFKTSKNAYFKPFSVVYLYVAFLPPDCVLLFKGRNLGFFKEKFGIYKHTQKMGFAPIFVGMCKISCQFPVRSFCKTFIFFCFFNCTDKISYLSLISFIISSISILKRGLSLIRSSTILMDARTVVWFLSKNLPICVEVIFF